MKKIFLLAIALFLAVTAAAQTSEESEVITQTIMKGELTQTVFAGDEIDQVFIVYDNSPVSMCTKSL